MYAPQRPLSLPPPPLSMMHNFSFLILTFKFQGDSKPSRAYSALGGPHFFTIFKNKMRHPRVHKKLLFSTVFWWNLGCERGDKIDVLGNTVPAFKGGNTLSLLLWKKGGRPCIQFMHFSLGKISQDTSLFSCFYVTAKEASCMKICGRKASLSFIHMRWCQPARSPSEEKWCIFKEIFTR